MSIINDALKKAGKENPSEFKPELLGKKHQTNWGPLFVLLVLLLITGPILAPAISIPFKGLGVPHSEALTKTPSAGQNVKAQFGIEEMPTFLPTIPGRPNLSLSGIVFSPVNHNDSYCLINGKIIKVGEGVDGAKLIKVTPDEVTLDYRGETIVLPVSV